MTIKFSDLPQFVSAFRIHTQIGSLSEKKETEQEMENDCTKRIKL